MTAPPRCYSYARFSKLSQGKGPSLKRQLEASRDYANRKGLDLQEEFELKELGKSAWTGEHLEEGSPLNLFVKEVKQGKIPVGSWLILESLDRLSRQSVNVALELLLSIINRGINVVTLADNERVYNSQIGTEGMLMSIIIMGRAHEESEMKSTRLRDVWKRKRQALAEAKDGDPPKKLTGMCPDWLELSKDKKTFYLIPEKAAVVRRIFKLAETQGLYAIERLLNEEGVPTFSESNGWYQSYLRKIITSRATIGEFQPCIYVGKTREPVGEPIQNYYEAAVTVEQFHKTHAAIASRTRSAGVRGRKGKRLSNLFTGLLFDGYSKASVRHQFKGDKKRKNGTVWKGKRYLVSDARRLNPNAPRCVWRYDDFEKAFLMFVEKIEWERLVNSDTAGIQAKLDVEMETLEAAIEELKVAEGRVQKALAAGTREIPWIVAESERLHDAIEAKKKLMKEVAKQKAKITVKSIPTAEMKATVKKAKDLETRFKIRGEIMRHIERIELYPNGYFRKEGTSGGEDYLEIESAEPTFEIFFNSGARQLVMTDSDDGAIQVFSGFEVMPEADKPKKHRPTKKSNR